MVGVSRSPLSKNVRTPARNPREIDRTTGVSYGRRPAPAPARLDRVTGVSYGQTKPAARTPVSARTPASGGMRMPWEIDRTTGVSYEYSPFDEDNYKAYQQRLADERVAREEADRLERERQEALRHQNAAAAARQAELARIGGAYSGAIGELETALGGVGGTYAPMLQAIQDLYGGQEQGVRDLFSGYSTQLGEMGTAAQGRIDAATQQAMERLAGIDPEAGAFQWNVQAGGVPEAAAANYLRAIGASPAEVDAARMLGESLIQQQLGTAQQLSAGTQAGLERERAARQAASALLSQQAGGQLAAQQAAYGAQLSAGELARIQALQAAGLSETQALQLAQRQEEERIRNAILQARLDAAAAGVTV